MMFLILYSLLTSLGSLNSLIILHQHASTKRLNLLRSLYSQRRVAHSGSGCFSRLTWSIETVLSSSGSDFTSSTQVNSRIPSKRLQIHRSLRTMSFPQQLVLVLLYYSLHVTYLSQATITLPFELSPTRIRNIGLDSLAGVVCLVLAGVYHVTNGIFSLSDIVHPDKVPWRRPRQHPLQSFALIGALFILYAISGLLTPAIITLLNIVAIFLPLTVPIQRNLLVVLAHFAWVGPAVLLLSKVKMFFGTGTEVRSSALTGERGAAKSRVISDIKSGGGSEDSAERVQSALTAVDFKETQDTAVTLSDGEDAGAHSDHEGSPATSLHNAAEAGNANTIGPSEITVDVALTGNAVGKEDEKREKKKKEVVRYGRVESPDFWKPRAVGTSDWFTLETKGNWAWWVMGGYSVSVLLFRVADWLNGRIVPLQWFDSSSGNIVNQMIAPEGNDLVALLIGAIAPCLSAPLWEEIFYRGLIFPWLGSVLPMALATPLSAVIFALHHARREVFIPLFTLGLGWACLYLLSGNLFVTVMVHFMWNSRVFLGTVLGY